MERGRRKYKRKMGKGRGKTERRNKWEREVGKGNGK